MTPMPQGWARTREAGSCFPSKAARRKSGLLLLALFLAGCGKTAAIQPSSEQAAGYTFEHHEVVTGLAEHQVVLTGLLLDGGLADIAAISGLQEVERRLVIYSFDDTTWVPRLNSTLPPEVVYTDVANIGGRDRLVTYEPGRLQWFDPESGLYSTLMELPSTPETPRRSEILHLDLARDLNGDGLDDLVVPDSQGFLVVIQMEGGALTDPVKIGTSNLSRRVAEMSMAAGSDGYRFDPWSHSRVHEIDYDRDGRNDLAFWNGGRLEVHFQDENGRFSPVSKSFSTNAAFDSEGLASFVLDARGETWKALHSLGDMNGDGIADLATLSPRGASLRKTWSSRASVVLMDSRYEVHFGTPTPGGTHLGAQADTSIQSAGVQLEMQQHDFDADGQTDIMFTIGHFSIRNLFGALLKGSVPLELEFYRMEAGAYPDQPNAVRKITAGSPPWWRGKFYPSVLIGDVNGDERADLVMQKGRKELHIFLGVQGPELFARRPQKVAVAMPKDEENVWLVDFNQDGKQDVLIHHTSTTKPNRVTTLIAR